MFENLSVAKQRYAELEKSSCDPEIISDPTALRDIMREMKQLLPLVETYDKYTAALSLEEEAKELLAAPGQDAELKALASEQLAEAKEEVACLTDELKLLLLPHDPNDERNVIVEIRGGAGGEEAALFAAALTKMYSMYAEKKGWKTEILNSSETELGGYKEVSFMITGEGAYSRLKYESGVHRVQRVPETESQGRIHTSTVTVAVLPEADDVEIEINPTDLRIDTYRSSGAGGQHVNTTDSAVRITHIPTGLVVECQDERSQYKNRDKAMKLLKTRLLDFKRQEQTDAIAADRKAQVGTGDRSERIRTYNFPQGRMSDHRIGLTLYSLGQIMLGDLDEIIDALTAAEKAKLLEQSLESEAQL